MNEETKNIVAATLTAAYFSVHKPEHPDVVKNSKLPSQQAFDQADKAEKERSYLEILNTYKKFLGYLK